MLIVHHKPIWKKHFNEIKTAIIGALAIPDLTIEHVGSTAVMGLAAKPIIDLDIVYSKPGQLGVIIKNLQSLGYIHVGDQGIVGREVFKRNSNQNHEVLDTIGHHLYACHSEGIELKRHLAFRDYLRKNSDARIQYEQLKLAIAQEANQDKKRYAALKEEKAKSFIESILSEVA